MASFNVVNAAVERVTSNRKVLILVCLGLGGAMVGIDVSIVNAMLPVVTNSLHTNLANVEWVVTIYLLVLCGMLLAFGRLGDIYGHKSILLVGFIGFTISSGLCGLASSIGWLIAFRILQGISGATFTNIPAILADHFPAHQRGRAMAIQMTIMYVATSSGPPLGGLLAAQFGWRSIFFINVPIGILATLMSHCYIPNDRPKGEVRPFDLLGAFLFFTGIFPLLLALNQGYKWGWTSSISLGLIALAVMLLSIFIKVEYRGPHPMLDLALFRNRVLAESVASSSICYLAENSTLFIVPFYLIAGRELTPTGAGLVLATQPLVMTIVSPIAGILTDRVGSRITTTLGLLAVTIGLVLLGACGAIGAHTSRVAVAMAVCGVGFGLFNAPNATRILESAPPDRRGIVSGVLSASRNIGLVMGAAVSGAIYTTVLSRTGGHRFGQALAITLLAVALITTIAMVGSWRGAKLADERK